MFAFHFSNYSVLKIFINKYFKHIHSLSSWKVYWHWRWMSAANISIMSNRWSRFQCLLILQTKEDNKFNLWSITCSVVKYLCPMFCLPEFYRRVLYDWCNGLNNVWFFNSIKTHSVSTYINYTNLWWIHGTTSFSGHSTHNYN